MLDIVAIIFLFLSLAGMAFMVYRKAPVLASYIIPEKVPEAPIEGRPKRFGFKVFSSDKNLLLQKFLSKIRILLLRTDNKTSEWMRALREKSLQDKTKFSDSYWQKLKK